MYVCVCVYIYIYNKMYVYTYTYTIHIHITYAYTRMYMHTYSLRPQRVSQLPVLHTYTQIHIHIHTYVHTCIFTCIHTYLQRERIMFITHLEPLQPKTAITTYLHTYRRQAQQVSKTLAELIRVCKKRTSFFYVRWLAKTG